MQKLLKHQGVQTPNIYSIIDAMQSMNNILRQETSCIRDGQLGRLSELQPIKQKSVTILVHLRRFLAQNNSYLQELPADARLKLQELNSEFATVAQENYDTLNGISTSYQSFLKFMQTNKLQDATTRTGYNSAGGYGNFTKAKPAIETWIAYNHEA